MLRTLHGMFGVALANNMLFNEQYSVLELEFVMGAGLLIQLALHPHRRLQCSQCVATGDLALADMAQPVGSGQLDKLFAGI